MKKYFMTVTLILGVMAGVVVLSSFTEGTQKNKENHVLIVANDPTVATNLRAPYYGNSGNGYEFIDVYISGNYYYAIVRSDSSKTHYSVLDNREYGESQREVGFTQNHEKVGDYRYYIIYKGKHCYFNL